MFLFICDITSKGSEIITTLTKKTGAGHHVTGASRYETNSKTNSVACWAYSLAQKYFGVTTGGLKALANPFANNDCGWACDWACGDQLSVNDSDVTANDTGATALGSNSLCRLLQPKAMVLANSFR